MQFLILSLFSFSLFAQSTDELIKFAWERTPYLKVYAHGLDSATVDVKQSKLWSNPLLTFQGGTLRSGSSQGPVTDITLSQPLAWPGKRQAAVEGKEFLKKISGLDFEEAKLNISHRVFLLVAEISALKQLESHNAERLARFSVISKFYSSRPVVSPVQRVEKNLLFSQMVMAEKMMITITNRKEALLSDLATLTGLEHPEVNFDWKNIPSPPALSLLNDELRGNVLLKKASLRQQLGANQVESAQYEARPDILVGLNYRQETVEPLNRFYHAQVALVIPIIDRGQHSVESARARLRRIEAEAQVLNNETRNELSSVHSNMMLAWRSNELFPLSKLKETENNFSEAEHAFKKGQIDTTMFLETDTQIHETIDRIFTSRVEYLTHWSKLAEMTGKLPEI
jgi:outer membrane protein TolC